MKKIKQKAFPKKAKLISNGGFYKIIPLDKFCEIINFPILKPIAIGTPDTPEVFYEETMEFLLKFQFDRVKRGYAEYKQFDCIKIASVYGKIITKRKP